MENLWKDVKVLLKLTIPKPGETTRVTEARYSISVERRPQDVSKCLKNKHFWTKPNIVLVYQPL